MDDILKEFLDEARENLEVLRARSARLEADPGDAEARESAYRAVHTIKGTCGFLGLERLENVATAGDLVLGRIYRSQLPITPAVSSSLRGLASRIDDILEGLAAEGSEPAGDDRALVEQLRAVAQPATGGTP